MGVESESIPPSAESEACKVLVLENNPLICSAQSRSAEAVQERLDRLIGEIYKLQTPHMDSKSGKPADVLIVRTHLLYSPFMPRL